MGSTARRRVLQQNFHAWWKFRLQPAFLMPRRSANSRSPLSVSPLHLTVTAFKSSDEYPGPSGSVMAQTTPAFAHFSALPSSICDALLELVTTSAGNGLLIHHQLLIKFPLFSRKILQHRFCYNSQGTVAERV